MIQGPKTDNNLNIEQIEGHARLLQAYELYNKLSDEKSEDFKKVKNYLADIIEGLFKNGEIGIDVVILSRIKSPASVVKNWKLGKNLDDIFGITLLTLKEDEMEKIKEEIKSNKRFNITSRKNKNEKRGYAATHFMFNVGDEDKRTKVECHLQTHDAFENVYTHIFYKVRRELGRDLTSEEEEVISSTIQAKYDKGELLGENLSNGRKSKIPQMWVTSFDGKGKMVEQELSEEMILTIMYPFLDISKKQELNSKPNQKNEDGEEVEL